MAPQSSISSISSSSLLVSAPQICHPNQNMITFFQRNHPSIFLHLRSSATVEKRIDPTLDAWRSFFIFFFGCFGNERRPAGTLRPLHWNDCRIKPWRRIHTVQSAPLCLPLASRIVEVSSSRHKLCKLATQ